MQVLAEIATYTDLLAALRARVDELKVSGETLDEVAGLTRGYFQKLIGPRPQRFMGPGMLDTVLATLGCSLALIEDKQALASLRHRLKERTEYKVRKPPSVVTFTSRTFQSWGRKGNVSRNAKLTAEERSSRARHAAHEKWRKISPAARAENFKKMLDARLARIKARQKQLEANPLIGDISQLERKIRKGE